MIFYKEMMYGLGEAKIRIVESSLLFFPNKERSALIEHSACDSIYPCGTSSVIFFAAQKNHA